MHILPKFPTERRLIVARPPNTYAITRIAALRRADALDVAQAGSRRIEARS